jgi:superfamily II DNA or RNA helicase
MIRHPLTAKFVKTGLFDGLRSFTELERRIGSITVKARVGDGDASNKARGDAFEVFVAGYLATQRAQLVKRLWPHMRSVSLSIRRRLGWKPKDHGADGLIETVDGEFRGYQAKFRTGRTPLPWAEVSTFFGVTDRCDARVLVTNSTSLAEVAENRSDFLSIRGNDLDDLTATDFRAILAWLKGGTPQFPKATPRPHQKTALAAICKAFKQQHRGTVVSACGTGKTLLALWAAEAQARRSVIVLLPSLALIRQTLRDWARHTNWKRFDYLCVCSDATVSQEEDSLVVRPTELPFSVTTDPKKVGKFLRHKFDGVKVIFTTYQSAPVVAKGMARGDAFDFGIFDEAHKTAGSEGKQNAFALSDANLRMRKRLFLTATPKKHRLPKKASERDKDLEPVYSMDQPSIYGPVIHKLSFGEAARRGIICSYKVIISVVTSSVAEQSSRNRGVVMVKGNLVRAPQVINQLAIAQAARKHRIRKAFTFHRNIPTADSFVSDGKEGISTHLPDFSAFHVNGKMSTADRESVLREFEEARCGLVSNVRCLTEGVDVPAVDMVAFMSPKRSKVDIVQAVGRAMRTSPATGKKIGYVLVPLHVELKKNESIEKAVARAGFDDIWQVLAAMQEQDEVLDEAIQRMQAERRLGKGFNEALFSRRVEVVGPLIALAALRRSVATQCLDRLARSWDEHVQMLLAYRKKHGHVRVPIDAGMPWQDLARWVKETRLLRRLGQLPQQRVDELNAIGFQWRFDGQTLDRVDGLLSEKAFRKASGISRVKQFRLSGLLKPVGYSVSRGGGITPFYHPRQIKDLRKRLGVTLDSTDGLLNEKQFARTSGITRIGRLRKQGRIKPVGFGYTHGAGVTPYYHPRQINQLRQAIGITLETTKGLLGETEVKEVIGLTKIAQYRRDGHIPPAGFAAASSRTGVMAYYHPKEIHAFKKRLGVTLESTDGLLTETQFKKQVGIENVLKYRKRRIVEPIGHAISCSSSGTSAYYHPRQVKQARKVLGITLETTKGLLHENAFRAASGFTSIHKYREAGLIRPAGYALTKGGARPFYHPRQIAELRKSLGITLKSTKGLLNERHFMERSSLTAVSKYRKQGLIRPVGFASHGSGIGPFYHPRQIKELRKVLGITLSSTEGLLNEHECAKRASVSMVASYRKKGLIKPVGYALAGPTISAYYHPRQIKEVQRIKAGKLRRR